MDEVDQINDLNTLSKINKKKGFNSIKKKIE